MERMTRKTLIGAGLVGLLGLAALLWASAPPGPGEPARGPPRDAPPTAGEPALEGAPPPPRGPNGAPPAAAADDRKGATPAAGAQGTATRCLVLEVRCDEGPPPDVLEVRVFDVDSFSSVNIERSAARREEGYQLEFGRNIPAGSAPRSVEVVVDHERYATVRERVDLPPWDHSWSAPVPVAVRLRPAHAFTGQVRDEAGDPVPGACVAAFEVGPEGPRVAGSLPVPAAAWTETDREGRYRLKLLGVNTWLVVAHAPPHLPASRRRELGAGRSVELEPLVLRQGATIEGVVSREGHPVAGVYVVASAVLAQGEEGRALDLGACGWELGWLPGDRWRTEGEVEAKRDGSFRIEGLAPGRYWIEAPLAVRTFGEGRRSPGVEGVEVEAPSRGVDLELPALAAHLEFRVTTDGAPLQGARVGLTTRSGASRTRLTDGTGSTSCSVAAEADFEVRVEAEGYFPVEFSVRSAGSGNATLHEVELRPDPGASGLDVHLEGPTARGIDRCHLHLHRMAPGAEAVQLTIKPESEAPPAPPRFRTGRLPAGRYAVRVAPGSSAWESTGYFLEERREVDLEPGARAVLVLTPRLGGRLRLDARDAAGRRVEARCTVRDASGAPQDVMFDTHGTNTWESSSARLGTLSPSTVSPALPEGTYTVELELDGHPPQRHAVRLMPGRTTFLDVTFGR